MRDCVKAPIPAFYKEKALVEAPEINNTDKDMMESNMESLETEISTETAAPVHSDEHNTKNETGTKTGDGEKTDEQEKEDTKEHKGSETKTIIGDNQIEGVEEAIEITDTPARKEPTNAQPVIGTEETAKVLQIRKGHSQLPVLGKPTIPKQIEKQKLYI